MMKKTLYVSEDDFIRRLRESLLESYPHLTTDEVKKQVELIKASKPPTNIIGLSIKDDTLAFFEMGEKDEG